MNESLKQAKKEALKLAKIKRALEFKEYLKNATFKIEPIKSIEIFHNIKKQ